MINYLLALAFVTVVGVVIGALMIRHERRHAERLYRATMEEMERRANARPPAPTEASPHLPAN